MTPQEAISYIENYTWSTTRLGLGRTRELLHAIGDPQKKLKFIHVAGSNGKGSTCAMLDAILRHAGYRTGLYTSPYIQDFCERMQVNGQNIPGEDLARITEQVRKHFPYASAYWQRCIYISQSIFPRQLQQAPLRPVQSNRLQSWIQKLLT